MTTPFSKWRDVFPEVPLVAHQLRDYLSDRWVRIHYLPDSQRYPASEDDYRELLKRQNTILNALPGTDALTLFVTEPSDEDLQNLAAACHKPFSGAERVPIGEIDPDAFWEGASWDVYAAEFSFIPGKLDFWLRSVADGNQVNAMIVNGDYSHICHLYDGGMDLILASTEERDQFRNQYSDWLSHDPSGL